MAGINFVKRVDSFYSLPSDFPQIDKWKVWINGDGYIVTMLDDGTFRIEGDIPARGGYVGVSFRPQCAVLCIGSPAFALSPAFVEWGLQRVNEGDWFIRADRGDGLERVEDEGRRELYKQALEAPDQQHVGIEPASGQLELRAGTERSKWIRRANLPKPSGEFVPDDAAETVRQTAYRAAYARIENGEALLDIVEEAAGQKAEKLREQAAKIRGWRRDSERLSEVEDDRDLYRSRVIDLEDEVADLKNKVGELEREKRKIEKELEQARGTSGKIAAVKVLREKLGVDTATAKQVVEEIA